MEFAIWLPVPVILIFGFMGFRDGVVKRLLEVVGIILTLIFTARFATEALPWMKEHTDLPEGAALFITWAGLFLVGFLLSKLLAAFLSKLIRLTLLGWVDKWGGAVVGMIIGTLFCSVILVAASQVPGGDGIQKAYEGNAWGRLLFHAAPNVYRQVAGLSGGRTEEVWSRVLDETREQADKAAENVKESATDAATDAVKDGVDEAREQAEEKLDDLKESAGG
jgi:Colicin V production protein